jgi:hypothetical protein
MTSGVVQEIPPASHRAETRGVIVAALALAVLWAGLVAWRRVPPAVKMLSTHQRSALADLDATERGLFTDLSTAVAEIRALQTELQTWPAPRALVEAGVEPFVEDAAWRQRGRHRWQKIDAHQADHALYWGMPFAAGAAEWALVWQGPVASVWKRPFNPAGAVPSAVTEELIRGGWSEIVGQSAGER